MFDTVGLELARSIADPESAYAALGRLADSHVGARLFTLMDLDEETGEGRRIYSNMPDVYPLFGRKPLPIGEWTETVITGRQVFVANTIGGIARVFPDHELISSLGCGSVMNIPVIAGDTVLGTMNCLDVPGAYGPDKVAAANDLLIPGLTCFLINRGLSIQGDQV